MFSKQSKPSNGNAPVSAQGRQGEIKGLLMETLQLMREKGMDRLVLDVTPMPRDMGLVEKLGGWTDMNQSYFRYYPYEVLTKAERELVDKHESHQVIALFLADANKFYGRDYTQDGVEVANRTNLVWMMPELKTSATQRFGTDFIVYPGEEGMNKFASAVAGAYPELTGAMLKENVDAAIAEYKSITRALIDASGVPQAIERAGNSMNGLPDAARQWLEGIIASANRE